MLVLGGYYPMGDDYQWYYITYVVLLEHCDALCTQFDTAKMDGQCCAILIKNGGNPPMHNSCILHGILC